MRPRNDWSFCMFLNSGPLVMASTLLGVACIFVHNKTKVFHRQFQEGTFSSLESEPELLPIWKKLFRHFQVPLIHTPCDKNINVYDNFQQSLMDFSIVCCCCFQQCWTIWITPRFSHLSRFILILHMKTELELWNLQTALFGTTTFTWNPLSVPSSS